MLKDNLQTFNIESKKTVNTMQFDSVCRVQIPNDKEFKNVLSIYALPMITTSERMGENLSFSGVTSYQIVCQTEDNSLFSLTEEISWQNTINLPSSGEYLLNVRSVENTWTNSGLNEIVVSTLLNIDLEMIMTETINTVAYLPEEYVVKEKQYVYNNVVSLIKDNFTEVSEQETNQKLDEILYNHSDVKLLNVKANIDSVTIEGDVYITTYALSSNEIVSIEKVVDFKQEVSCLNVTPENVINIKAFLNKVKVACSTSEIDSKTNLIYSLDIGLEGVVYSLKTLSLIDDAFSIKKQTNVSLECVLKEAFLERNSIDFLKIANLDLGLNVEKVLYLANIQSTITEKQEYEDKCRVCGSIELTLICMNGNNDKFSVKGYIPFEQEIDALKTDNIFVMARVEHFKLVSEKDVEVNLKLNFVIDKTQEEYVTFISDIEETEDRECENEAISVYVVKNNEKLFDVAKNLCVKPEEIIMQNDLDNIELEEGEKIVIYRRLDINF